MLTLNNKGFTLVEVTVAIGVMLVGLLGLLGALNVMTEQNLKNAARNEAMEIAENYMNQLRVTPFVSIPSLPYPDVYSYSPIQEKSRLRGVTRNYTVLRTSSAISDNSVLLTVSVRWEFKNTYSSQGLQTVRSQ